MGKSLSWVIGLLWSFDFIPCLSLIVYPSEELGSKINKEKLEPLMKAIPRLAAELELPRSQKKDCYHFSNLKCYFSGAGSRVTSQSAKIRIADEIDDWIEHEGKVTNLLDLRKRARTFNESMLFKVCSPTEKTGAIWKEFQKGSKGFWYLRCQNCGQLTMRSADIHNMQWELDENENVKEESIRLVCPVCKHEHKESDKKEMNINGCYIHENPGLVKTLPSFQWGALACQWGGLLSWLNIANAQMLAGKSGSYQDQAYFDNSIRGLPFQRRAASDSNIMKLKRHVYEGELPISDFVGLFYAGDTQDDCLYYVIAAIDKRSNIYILKAVKEPLLDNIRQVVKGQYYNMKLIAAVQDEGGHRPKEIRDLVDSIPGFWTYKGDNRISKRIERSKDRHNHLKVKEQYFEVEVLFYLHGQEKKENNFLYFAKDLPDDFYLHLLSYQPDNTKKNGDQFENWKITGKHHDYFDCLKMLYPLIEFVKLNYPATVWKQGGDAEWIKRNANATVQKRPAVRNAGGFSVTNWRH